MATQETQQLDAIISSTRRKMMTMGGVALAGIAFAGTKVSAATASNADILNFALNLEYLEANFYTLAVSGQTLAQFGAGVSGVGGAGGTVSVKSGSTIVPWSSSTSTIKAYATETALEERKHVAFLRNALSTAAVAQPNLDLNGAFNALANLATIGPAFDPFASEANFLIGAYIFEDVGVTAYSGAAPLILANAATDSNSSTYLDAAAGILAVEAYHAGLIRSTIYGIDPNNTQSLLTYANKISALRNSVDGVTTPDDYGLGTRSVALNGSSATYTGSTIVNADTANSIAFARNTTQVLHIVYASMVTVPVAGGFFPAGMNGTIK